MAKYIDVQELIKNIPELPVMDVIAVLNYVGGLPAADVAPVRHGKWLHTHHTSIVECSLCGGTVATLWKGYFCQNCGAKMDGGATHD